MYLNVLFKSIGILDIALFELLIDAGGKTVLRLEVISIPNFYDGLLPHQIHPSMPLLTLIFALGNTADSSQIVPKKLRLEHTN